jgi:hypothetical protein
VVDKKLLSDLGSGMNLDTGEETSDMRYQPGKERYLPIPQGMRYTMILPGMESRIGEYYFTGIPDSRVMFEYSLYVFPDTFKYFTHLFLLLKHGNGKCRYPFLFTYSVEPFIGSGFNHYLLFIDTQCMT